MPIQTDDILIDGMASSLKTQLDALAGGGTTPNNVVVINSETDLPTASGGEHLLAANTTYIQGAAQLVLSNALKFSDGSAYIGYNAISTSLVYTGTGAAIRGTDVNMTLKSIAFTANHASGSVFNCSNAGKTKTFVMTNCVVAGSTSGGTITGFKTVVQQLVNSISNTDGISYIGCNDLFIVSCNYSSSSATNNIHLLSGTFNKIIIDGCNFDVLSGKKGITSGAITITSSASLLGNVFSGVGTYISGFTHETAKWKFDGNIGIANRTSKSFIDSTQFRANSCSNPSTDAVPSNYFGATGTGVLSFGGSNPDKDGAQFSFLIPDDYFDGGKFEIIYTTSTGSGNAKFQMILSTPDVGDDFATQTETGLFVIAPATTQYQRRAAIITPTSIIAGRFVSARLFRLANDGADSSSSTFYVAGIRFTYNAK